MVQQNPFDQFDTRTTRNPAPIFGPAEDPRDARLKDIQIQGAQIQQQLDQQKLSEAQRKAQEEADKLKKLDASKVSALASLKRVIEKIDQVSADASDNSGWGETGATGAILRKVPGTAAKDLASNIQTIDANSAFSALQAMRDASPTGGALGQVTERELDLLKSTIANLDPDQSQEQFLTNLAEARQAYADMFARAGGDPSEVASKTEAQKRDELGGPGFTIKFNDEKAPVTGYRLTKGQEGQVAAAIRNGDEGEAVALLARFSGYPTTDETRQSVRATIAKVRENPNQRFSFDYGPVDSAAQEAEDRKKYGDYLPQAIEDRKDLIADPFIRGVADIVPFSDEIAAGGNSLLSGGTYEDNLRRERAIDEADERVNFRPRVAGQLSGAAFPVGRWLGLSGKAQGARSALSYGKEGAALGGLYAAGKADPLPDASLMDSFGDRAAAVPSGAALGGATAYGLSALGNALRSRRGPGSPPPPPGSEDALDIAQSAADEGIPISRPIADASRRDAMAYLEGSFGGGGPVRHALKGTADAIETRAAALGGQGVAQEGGVIGQRIQDAGERYIERSRGVGGRLYDRADQMAAGKRATGRETVRVLDEQIAELQGNANTNAPLIKYLQEIRADFVDDAGNLKAKSIGEIRDLRTGLRGNINARNLTATDAERRIGKALDAAKADIQRDLGRDAPAAVRQYERADKFWRERKAEIDQVVRRVIGNKDDKLSGEQVWQRIRTMASEAGDGARLGRLWDKLEPEEQADAAATIAAKLGRRSADEEFSPALFVSSVRAISPAARRQIFGPEGARSIANLRRVSEAYRDTAARLNNSRSGQVQQWGGFFKDLFTRGGVGGALGYAAGGPVGGVAGAAISTGGGVLARNLSARALMSPNLTRWMEKAVKADSPPKIERAVEALSVVARRDPAIAQEALGLQRQLQQAFASTPTRAAAEEERQ